MLFGIDKWPSGDGRERDEARSDRDGRTNDCKSGYKYGIKQYKIKENASFFFVGVFWVHLCDSLWIHLRCTRLLFE